MLLELRRRWSLGAGSGTCTLLYIWVLMLAPPLDGGKGHDQLS